MDFIGNVTSAVIGGMIGAVLTYWRMRVDKAARKDDLHNEALVDIENWEEELNRFLSINDLTKPTKGFRLLIINFQKTKNDVAEIKSHTRSLIRRIKDIRSADLTQDFNVVLETVEKLDNILAGGSIDNEEIAKSVDKLRDSFASAQTAVSAIEHR